MQEAAVAKKYASKLKAKADPERKGSGWWRMEDLKAAFKRFADNPDDPEASYFLAKALQMAGQADKAEERYDLFADRCRQRFGSAAAAIEHYEDVVAKLEKRATADGDTGRADPKRRHHLGAAVVGRLVLVLFLVLLILLVLLVFVVRLVLVARAVAGGVAGILVARAGVDGGVEVPRVIAGLALGRGLVGVAEFPARAVTVARAVRSGQREPAHHDQWAHHCQQNIDYFCGEASSP